MNDNADWKAAMASEIFREYAFNELQRVEAEKVAAVEKSKRAEEEEAEAIEAFAHFEKNVRNSPEKLLAFRALKDRFLTDAAYKAQTHPLFVEAVMLLDLDE